LSRDRKAALFGRGEAENKLDGIYGNALAWTS
jgi:hypothetical protein